EGATVPTLRKFFSSANHRTSDWAEATLCYDADEMTELLQRAIEAIEKLPVEIQDAIAARLLEEAADEQAWEESFRNTTDAQWEKIHAWVQRDIEAHGITPLERGVSSPNQLA